MVHQEAFVTLATTDDYGIGALVLAHSLRDSGTTRKIVCLTSDRVTQLMMGRLRDVFDDVIIVEPIRSTSRDNLTLLGRPDLLYTFTKLHVWNLTQFNKIVFLDADTLVLANVDDLFSHVEFSACPDIGWPDCFNSGVFVASPSKETYNKLLKFAETEGSFDGGDQGLLNVFFSDWKRLPFVYNVTPSATYSYAPAYKRFAGQIKIAHFIGIDKPWLWDRFTSGGPIPSGRSLDAWDLVQKWWNVHDKHIGKWTPPQTSYGVSYSPQVGSSNANIQPGGSTEEPPNPFFKSRYDWNEEELKLKGSGGSSGKKLASEFEDERHVQLKKDNNKKK